jgi:hypothetical protein
MYTRDFSKDKIAILEDSWLDRYQVIDLGGDTTNFNFSVTSDPASQASNRFRVIFVGHSILPVHFTGISAMAAPGNIKLLWTAADDKDVTRYEIERSSNGVDFLTAGTVLPGGNGAYTWLDQSPLKGNNYYRVRSISLSGEIIYSKVVRASLFTDAGGITVYPNPVAGHMLNLSLSGMKADVYTISLLNNLGQPVMQQPLKHGGGNAAYTIRLNSELPPGKYSLLIQQPGESPQQKSLLIL